VRKKIALALLAVLRRPIDLLEHDPAADDDRA